MLIYKSIHISKILDFDIESHFPDDFNNELFQNPMDICGANVLINGKNITLISNYVRQHRLTFHQKYLNYMVNKSPYNYYILGDFNSKHPNWDSTLNLYGTILNEFLKEKSYKIINNDKVPLFFYKLYNNQLSSKLDLNDMLIFKKLNCG